MKVNIMLVDKQGWLRECSLSVFENYCFRSLDTRDEIAEEMNKENNTIYFRNKFLNGSLDVADIEYYRFCEEE